MDTTLKRSFRSFTEPTNVYILGAGVNLIISDPWKSWYGVSDEQTDLAKTLEKVSRYTEFGFYEYDDTNILITTSELETSIKYDGTVSIFTEKEVRRILGLIKDQLRCEFIILKDFQGTIYGQIIDDLTDRPLTARLNKTNYYMIEDVIEDMEDGSYAQILVEGTFSSIEQPENWNNEKEAINNI